MNSKRLLIVDDDKSLRTILGQCINFIDPQHEIVEAASGSEALSQLRLQKGEEPFDLILVDYDMPAMNGLELARIIRQKWPNVRVVIMTGYFNPTELQNEIWALKLDGLLEKPISLAQLKKYLHHTDDN